MEDVRRISDDGKALAEACSMHNRSSNKLWTVAATLTLLAVAANSSAQQSIKMLGFDINVDSLYVLLVFSIGTLNIAYCSSHAQAFKTAEVFNEYVIDNRNNLDAFTANYNLVDAYYCLVAPGFTRMYPLARVISNRYRKHVYAFLKFSADLIFIITPLVGVAVSVYKSNMGINLLCAALFLTTISALSSILLLITVFRWIFTRQYAVTRRADIDYFEPRAPN